MEYVLMNDLSSNATSGEQRFAQLWNNVQEEFLGEHKFRLYFEPNGLQKSPDFSLYSQQHGVLFFEIKDHNINSILNFDLHSCKLQYSEGPKIFKFTRNNAISFIQEFKQAGQSIPAIDLFVFPNVTETQIEEKFEIDTRDLSNPFIFSDDFDNYDKLLKKIKYHAQQHFKYRETDRSKEIAINKITRKLESSVIEKRRDSSLQTILFEEDGEEINEDRELFLLSETQERTLRKFMNRKGYRFLKGHAGTGKTVLIIARAQYLASTIQNIKILITYYTSQLDGTFRHLAEKFPNQITALRMGKFCQKIIPDNNINNFDKYYADCVEVLKSTDSPLNGFYDFILVDEGQDFRPELGQIIELLAKGKSHQEKNVLIAYDDFQALNTKEEVDTRFTFRGKQRGRVTILDHSFRTPKEIAVRAEKLIGEKIESVRSVPRSFNHHRLSPSHTVGEYVDIIINRIRNSATENIEFKDIAIIYPHHSYLHDAVEKELSKINKPIQKFNRKSSKSIRGDSQTIKLLSSSYCKGLDFKVVFLIHFDELSEEGTEIVNKKAKEHLYVSMTRTLKYLFIPTKKDNPILDIILEDIII